MMTQEEIEPVLRGFIIENFLFRDGGDALSDTTSFLETGLIDSTGVLELVFFLEKRFGIKVLDAEMLPENLDSIRQLGAYIRRKLEAQHAAA
jgi:acyl carrier protein